MAVVLGVGVVVDAVELRTVAMEVWLVFAEPGNESVAVAQGLGKDTFAVVEGLGKGTGWESVVGIGVVVAEVELDIGTAAVEVVMGIEGVKLGTDMAVAAEGSGKRAVVEVGTETGLAEGLKRGLVGDNLVFGLLENQPCCNQAVVVLHKSFGKTAGQMNHSTMGYRQPACIANSCNNWDMSLESGPLQETNSIGTLVFN